MRILFFILLIVCLFCVTVGLLAGSMPQIAFGALGCCLCGFTLQQLSNF